MLCGDFVVFNGLWGLVRLLLGCGLWFAQIAFLQVAGSVVLWVLDCSLIAWLIAW